MPDLFVVFRVALFSGFVSCRLAMVLVTRIRDFIIKTKVNEEKYV